MPDRIPATNPALRHRLTGGARARVATGRDEVLRRTVDHYRELLGMPDWDVRAQWVPSAKLGGNRARAVPAPERKILELFVNEESPLDDEFREDVIHELAHGLVSPIVRCIKETPASIMLEEQAVESLTKAIRRAEKTPDAALFRRAIVRFRKELPERIRRLRDQDQLAVGHRARGGVSMDSDKVKAAIAAIKEGNGDAALEILEADLVAAAGGDAEPIEPVEPDGDEMATEPPGDDALARTDDPSADPAADDDGARSRDDEPADPSELAGKNRRARKQLAPKVGSRDRVYALAAKLTGRTDGAEIEGALTALEGDRARMRKAIGDLTAERDALKSKANARERLDLLGKLVAAEVHTPGEVYRHDETTGEIKGPAKLWGPGPEGRTLANLRGYVAERLRNAAPTQRSPFEPAPTEQIAAAQGGAMTADDDRAIAARNGLDPEAVARSRKALFGNAGRK